ncbi:unnamed protein product [Pylaiella littoralis]
MWVLLTTRDALKVGVKPNERVRVDQLTRAEAEDVLRGAARLPPDECLCDAAADVLEICDYAAMDIAFVGRWESVRTPNGGDPMGREAWAGVLREITAQKVKAENAGGMDDLDPNRLGVLRAGFEYIASENVLAGKLYATLAVFPHGHAFGQSDAGVLLNCSDVVVRSAMTVLERWGVLRKDASDVYSMHDAHMDFARGMLTKRGDLREQAVQRWTLHLSRLEVAVDIDLDILFLLWDVLEHEVGEKGWFDTRPYDDQLVQMDLSDRSKLKAVDFAAELYSMHQKFAEEEFLMKRVLKHCDSRDVQVTALYHIGHSLIAQGRFQEYDDLERRLGDCDVAYTLDEMGRCALQTGRREEAESLLKRALEIKEAKLGADHMDVAGTLLDLGACARKAWRPGEAEAFF